MDISTPSTMVEIDQISSISGTRGAWPSHLTGSGMKQDSLKLVQVNAPSWMLKTRSSQRTRVFRDADLQAEEERRHVDGGARVDREGGPVDANLRQRLVAAGGRGAEGGQHVHQRRHHRRSGRRLHRATARFAPPQELDYLRDDSHDTGIQY